jgi:6-phosphogluconolactonase
MAIAAESRLYVGTYTGPKSRGIYVCGFDSRSGTLSPPRLAAELQSPSFLATSADRSLLYAVNEVSDHGGKKSGAVSALAIDPVTGTLSLINQQPSGGAGPCHVSVNPAGTHVFVANYGGGSVSVFPVRAGGALGEASAFVQHQGSSVNKQRQEAPHAHGIHLDASARWVIVPDLGLDQLKIYRFDPATGTLAAGDPAAFNATPGSGPRHAAFQPGGKLVCAINELDSTLSSFRFDPASGRLSLLDTASTLPAPVAGNSTAEIAFSPDGRFVYGSNRGHDSIAVFELEASTGKLKALQHEPTGGRTPRNFAISPDGRWLLAANQGSETVTIFARDLGSGRLTSTGREVSGIGSPVCLVFLD